MRCKGKLNYLFAEIVNGYKAENKFIKIKSSKFILKVLFFLYKNGYVNGYHLSSTNRQIIYIFLKYKLNGYNFLNLFKYFIKNNKFKYTSYKKLKRYFSHSHLYVLSTTRGIITGSYSVFFKIGGFILFKVG